MDNRLSLLGLFHPDGNPGTYQVIGNNCPPRLHPGRQDEPGEGTDLLILAPSEADCKRKGWILAAVQLFASSLHPDGVGFLLTRPRWRSKIVRLLKESGLRMDLAVGHLPDWTASDYLVPFTTQVAHYAFTDRITKPAWKSSLARGWFGLPGSGLLLGLVWPSAGLVFRHPEARPLFEWLFRQYGAVDPVESSLVRTSWRGDQAVSLLYLFPRREKKPAAVAKVILGDPAKVDIGREANALILLGPAAQQAGARVPQLLSLSEIRDHPCMLQTLVDGQPVDDLLRSHPGQLKSTLDQVASWLERWHRQTVAIRSVAQDDLDRMILQPAALLAPLLKRGEEYQAWLIARCRAVVGFPGSFVSTHNDLTTANLLIDRQGRLGVIDWESGQAEGWPLVDFFYTMTDAVMNSVNSFDRLEAFKTCFAPGGRYTFVMAKYRARLESAASLNKDFAELSFHACWLHHARNEHNKNNPGDPRPFLRILQWLALNSSIDKGSVDKV